MKPLTGNQDSHITHECKDAPSLEEWDPAKIELYQFVHGRERCFGAIEPSPSDTNCQLPRYDRRDHIREGHDKRPQIQCDDRYHHPIVPSGQLSVS